MVRAAQKGEMKNPSKEVSDVADDISVKDAKKFAKTKHKGLPEIKEGKKKGLWDNIHAKRKRGESPAKKGDKDYPETLNVEGTAFEIDKSAHKAAQKKAKMRNLARGNENPNEKAAAEKKAGGPKLVGEGAAWTKKSGKNKEGGLNEKGRKSYERENPGSDLKAPQPEGGSRKKSFCARMGGMKKKLTSAKTANDPDSRINKSLRKWKCNEDLTGDMKTDLEKHRVPRGPGGNPIRMGDKVRSMKSTQPLGQLKVKYGAGKVREYYKKNKAVSEEVKKGRHPRDQKELDRAQAYIKKNPNFGKKEVNEEASYKDFTKKAQDASSRVKKEKQTQKDANAKSAYKDRVTKGVRFYDKKGSGHIKGGKKVYS